MKKIFAFILVFLISIFSVYAEGEKLVNLTSNNITENSVGLSWSPVDGYYIYEIGYSNSSREVNSYDMVTDYIEGTDITISNLESGKTYYFSLYGYDELGTKNILSDEIYLNTLNSNNIEALKVIDAKMYDLNKIKVTFSNELNIESIVDSEFKMNSINDEFKTYNIIDAEVLTGDNKSIILTLDIEPEFDREYKIVALDIIDIYNQNIEYGIDSEIVFYAEETILEEVVEETNSGTVIDNTDEVELNSAKEEEKKESNVTGTDLSEDDVNKNIISIANENDKLPQTGPEQVLLLILAIIFTGLFFVSRFKKS